MAYKFNKEKFLASELGSELRDIVIALSDIRYTMELLESKNRNFGVEMTCLHKDYEILLPQLKIILLVLKQFYNLNCKYDYSVVDKEDVFAEKDFFVYIDNKEKEILFVDNFYKIRMHEIAKSQYE